MQQRPFGNHGTDVSVIGQGTWQLDGRNKTEVGSVFDRCRSSRFLCMSPHADPIGSTAMPFAAWKPSSSFCTNGRFGSSA